MKTLFDRLSDLLRDRDPLARARALAGREMRLLAVGTDPEMPPGFETPFARTAAYLDMAWRGHCYVPARDRKAADRAIRAFAIGIEGPPLGR